METIVALATPQGKSGVAILRISGGHARETLKVLNVQFPLKPRYAHFATLIHPDTKHIIDDSIVLFFPAPYSFTGEDVVEIQCHGSRVVIQELISVLLAMNNVRYAQAGEFSRRALENGKMDLMQVEALMDVIDAETPLQKALALQQLKGDISRYYKQLELQLIEARAFCEVFIDFPDEDLPLDMDIQINQKIDSCLDIIDNFLSSAIQGRQIREGIQIAIIGKPNAGKSTLLNAIAQRQVAITSPTAGTTRDAIELYKDINGIPCHIFDTAGIRAARNEVETQGIAISKKIAENADIAILLLDGTKHLNKQLLELDEIVSRETICVINKADLKNCVGQIVSRETISISAKNGSGIEKLLEMISERLRVTENEQIYITRERHVAHLQDAKMDLQNALNESDLVIKAEHLRFACNSVSNILGKIHLESVLDHLFSTFCIGK